MTSTWIDDSDFPGGGPPWNAFRGRVYAMAPPTSQINSGLEPSQSYVATARNVEHTCYRTEIGPKVPGALRGSVLCQTITARKPANRNNDHSIGYRGRADIWKP